MAAEVTRISKIQKMGVEMITCPFCTSKMLAVSPDGIVNPAFRCTKCNVRIVVTNQSYLPVNIREQYKSLVKNKKLGTQEQS